MDDLFERMTKGVEIDFDAIKKMNDERPIEEDNINKDNNDITTSSINDFSLMLAELDKKVSNADGSVNAIIREKDDLENLRKDLENKRSILEDDRFNFEKEMKEEYQKLHDLQIDFEQEKNRVFGDIQNMREDFARKQREFESYRKEQLDFIENSKNSLNDNYQRFNEIVANFNAKMKDLKDE